MIFKRTPSQVGHNGELCHPPKYLDKGEGRYEGLREGKKRQKYEKCGFKSSREGKFVHITYAAVPDETENFKGCWVCSGYSALPRD